MEPVEDLRVFTPPPSPKSGALVPYGREVVVTDLPFLEFRCKLEELFRHPLGQPSLQISSVHGLREIPPVVAHYLCPLQGDTQSAWISNNDNNLWQSISKRLADFPVPLRPLDTLDTSAYLWLIEFIVIGSTNGLLEPYKDDTLWFLVDFINHVEVLDELVSIVRRYDFYVIIEKILELHTSTTVLFGARALLSCVAQEDERLLEILLRRRVPVDELRHSVEGHYISAIHIAVELQNHKVIRRLLEAGIDHDGYMSESTSHTSRPLSRLLFLFSVRAGPRVTRIYPTTVKLILEAKSNTHSLEECESYIGSLLLQAWAQCATELLKILQAYCQTLINKDLEPVGYPLIHFLAMMEDGFASLISAMLSDASLRVCHGQFKDYTAIFEATVCVQCLPIVQLLLKNCSTHLRHLDVLDEDDISWLLRSKCTLVAIMKPLCDRISKLADISLWNMMLDHSSDFLMLKRNYSQKYGWLHSLLKSNDSEMLLPLILHFERTGFSS